MVGYTIVRLHDTIEAQPLPPSTLAQKAKIMALTQILILGQGERITIYTDSKYVFLVLYAHAALWKERVLLSVWNSLIKHEQKSQIYQRQSRSLSKL